ncbi:MAG: metal ABC transporter permease [Patescibacteria group bacterium]|nr:metal ABC transporter permease [Patescibacteria group bacterium]
MLEMLAYPFMQKALITGLFLGVVLSLIGVFVILRRMAFFSDGIAHASLSGAALGYLLNTNPLAVSILFSAIFAVVIAQLEKRAKLSSDAIIGLIFTSGMAIGILLLSLGGGYRPELTTFLFGDILAIKWSEVGLMVGLGIMNIIFILLNYKRLALMILNEDLAYVNGIKIDLLRNLLYVSIAVTVVMGMKVLGIILVSALLIIPIISAKLISRSFRSLMVTSVAIGVLSVLCGIFVSVRFDLPTGATIVLTGMGIFAILVVYSKSKQRLIAARRHA